MKPFPKSILGTLKSIFYAGIVLYVSLALYVATYTRPAPYRQDVIVVLGARSYTASAVNPCLQSRVRHGALLYHEGYADHIILTGGDDSEDGRNEAETMQAILGSYDVPQDKVLLEKKAASTFENLLYSKKIMDERDLTSVLIVTEPFHAARAVLVAKTLRIPYSYSVAEESPCWRTWKYLSRFFLREPLVIAYYVVTGKIHPAVFFVE